MEPATQEQVPSLDNPYPFFRVRCMAGLYVVLTIFGLGLVWGRSGLTGVGNLTGGPGMGASLAAGLGLAVLVLAATPAGFRSVRWMRRLARVMRRFLGPLSWSDAVLLGLLSGVGEEVFFRAALQPWLGLVPTSLVFGGLHVLPPIRHNWPWAVFAMAFGFAVGALYDATSDLAGPVAAHMAVNAVNLYRIGRL
jgi:CAAX protease family protein